MIDTAAYFERWRAGEAQLAGEPPRMLPLMERLWPICRSITGDGVRQTLDIIGDCVTLVRESVPSGTQCFDWIVPPEWNIRDAYVKDASGRRVIDFQQSNLHVVGYSTPVSGRFTLEALQPHLHSLPSMPDAIPYRTSYYRPTWGFCLRHADRERLADGEYEVHIDSTLEPGQLDFAQSVIAGRGREVLLSTYICHPSLAQNELSGPVLLTTLMQQLSALPEGRFGYRGVFTPETIGTIAFLSRHYESLNERIAAGFVVTCVGDDGPYTYVRSKRGATLADRAAEHVLAHVHGDREVSVRPFDPVGSDERQFCSPGINWPVGSLMRSRHGEYREYHTSLDDLSYVSETGLQRSLCAYLRILQVIEINCRPLRTRPHGEPQLGRYGLYTSMVTASVDEWIRRLLHVLSFADGDHDLIAIAEGLGVPVWELLPTLEGLAGADLITLND
ncbi:MAG TPA: DUF4910 domain-containing protein [Vicinamibacterales bacterium]|nr:DUF4910 domain-containing protein [Vicinamibacterales bacterium]